MALIKPTLFVGLGTTGAKILKELQEKIFEEYMEPDFPVIGLLSFVTAAGDRDYLSARGSDNNAIHLQVPSTTDVQSDIREPKTRASKALKEWVPDELFSIPGFTDGSTNIRVAGRLHLWREYDRIRAALVEAGLACTKDESLNRADQIFHTRLTGDDKKPAATYIDGGLNVFIVGTLSGGTCSGMAPEMGYVVRNAIQKADKVIGVFTVPNATQAANPQNKVWSANSYAALSELGYHYHPAAISARGSLPDGTAIPPDVNYIPYDGIYLMSPSTMLGDEMTDGANKFDHDALLQMISMSLFMDVCAGTYGTKNEIRDNHRQGFTQKGDHYYQPDGLGGLPRVFSSFGAATIMYPKYRLARAAACEITKRVMNDWLATRYDEHNSMPYEKRLLDTIRDTIFPILTNRDGHARIEDDIVATCTSNNEILRHNSMAFRAALPDFPHGKSSLSSRFLPGGQYQLLISEQFKMHASEAIRKLIREYYRELRSAPKMSLPAVQNSMQKIRKQLLEGKSTYEKRQGNTTLTLGGLEPFFDKLDSLEHDLWIKALFLKRSALAERKQQILSAYERSAKNTLSVIRAKYQALLLGIALEELDGLLGRLEKVISCLRQCHDPANPQGKLLSKEYKEILDQLETPSRNMRYLYPKATAPEEATALVNEFNLVEAEKMMYVRILGSNTDDQLQFDEEIISQNDHPERLINKIFVGIIRSLLSDMKSKNIMRESIAQWDAETTNLVRYSAPYVEFESNYDPLTIPGNGRQFVFAPAKNETEITSNLVPKLPSLIATEGWVPHALESYGHQMIFYVEEPGFSCTYMKSFNVLEAAFNDGQSSGAGQPARYWSDRRWVESGGPDTGKETRLEYISFMLETTYEVLFTTKAENQADSDSTKLGGSTGVFSFHDIEQRQLPYFEMPAQNGVQQLRIQLYDDADYQSASDRFRAEVLIPYLKHKIKLSVREEFGQVTFEALCNEAANHQDKERALSKASGDWNPEKEENYENSTLRIRAYLAHIRRDAWQVAYTPEDHRLMKELKWLATY